MNCRRAISLIHTNSARETYFLDVPSKFILLQIVVIREKHSIVTKAQRLNCKSVLIIQKASHVFDQNSTLNPPRLTTSVWERSRSFCFVVSHCCLSDCIDILLV